MEKVSTATHTQDINFWGCDERINLSSKLNNVNRIDNIRDKAVTCQPGLALDCSVLELLLCITHFFF